MSSISASNKIDDGWREDITYEDCARFFFNESHEITKERFFQVCCRTWMEDVIVNKSSDANIITYERLWMGMKRIYLSSKKSKNSSSVINWILPDLMSQMALNENPNDYYGTETEESFKVYLMGFWMEFYKTCDDRKCEDGEKSSRATKRRRLGFGRFAPAGYKGLLKGQYKLPAIYLLISIMKEIGLATNWLELCNLAHELPSTFKTFAGNDILAGLALVGLHYISTGNPLTGISLTSLFTTYFAGIK